MITYVPMYLFLCHTSYVICPKIKSVHRLTDYGLMADVHFFIFFTHSLSSFALVVADY